MKEIDNQLSTPEQSGGMPSHPVTFVSNDEPSPMPWPNTWYPVTPIGPETEYPCPCSEGDSGTGSTDNNSVDFSIEFGRFPKWPELSGGRLMLNLNMMDTSLCWGTAFQYEHVSQRRLEVVDAPNVSGSSPEPADVSQAVVKTERGFPRYYGFAPNASGAKALGSSQMFNDGMRRVTVDGVSYLEEVQESGMIMRFRPHSALFDHIVTPRGVKITFAELASELQMVRQDAYDSPNSSVESFNAFSWYMLKQVWNKTDGLLDLSDVRSIKWFAPGDVTGRRNDGTYTIRSGAVAIKTWKLSWTFLDEEMMVARRVDDANPEVTQMMLKTLRIEEPGGFISEWRAGLYPDDLTLVKGEGDDAISIVTRCLPAAGHENMIARDLNGQTMVAGGYYTDKKEKFKYVYTGVAGTDHAVLCSSTKEVYQRRVYGDVLLSKTEGYESPYERTWTYEYGNTSSSPNYGKRVRETRPDGSVVQMEYDSKGNMVQRTEPWYGDIQMRTSYTYSDQKFNDRRLVAEHVALIKGSIFHTLEQTTYSYTEQNGIYYEDVRKTLLGQQWIDDYGQSWYSNHPDCPYANGRLKGKWEIDGPEPSFTYSLCSEYGATWKCEETLQMYDTPLLGQSTRIIHYYAENGDEVATDHQVNIKGEGFVSIDLRRMVYDASHRVIRTDYANGLYSLAEWGCAGPLWETDIRGLQTRYTYDGAKRLVRVERDAALPVQDWNDTEMTGTCPNSLQEMTYDGAGNTLSVTSSIGDKVTTISMGYDILGRMAFKMDDLGRTTQYSYSQDGLATTEVTPSGATLITQRIASGLVTGETGTGQASKYYSYDMSETGVIKNVRLNSSTNPVVEEIRENGKGQILQIRCPSPSDPSSMEVLYEASYKLFGKVSYERKGNSWPVIYIYDNLLETLHHQMRTRDGAESGALSKYSLYTSYKKLSELPTGLPVDAEGLVFREEKSAYFVGQVEVAKEYRYELISRTNTSLAFLDSLILYKDAYGCWSWKKVYNEGGNVRVLNGREGCGAETEEISLNGDLVRLTEMDGTTTQCCRMYGTGGDTLTIRDSRGKDTVILSDAVGREIKRTDQDGKVTTTSYDAVTGKPFCVTTPDGKQMWYAYDFRGRLVRRYGTAVEPMKWEYDEQDHIVALHTYRSSGNTLDTIPSSGSDVTRWNYDPATGVLLEKVYADGSKTLYTYDKWWRLVNRVQARGIVTTYEYDPATGQVASISHSDGTPSVSIDYDAMERISTIHDASGTRSVTYTGLEDIASEATSGMTESILSFQRDSMGRPSGHVLSLNEKTVQQVQLGYDAKDRISTALLNGSSFTYGYDAATGWLNRLAYPNGMVRNTMFHANLPLPVSLTYMKGTSFTPELKHAYTWDNMRRPSMREDYVGSTALSRRHTYGYNARGELTGDTMNAGGSFSYAYDNIGNRSTASEQGTTIAYQSNNLNQYTTVTRTGTPFTPAYDADGNQTSVNTSTGTWSVQYNADNRPVVFTQGNRKVECVYDYLGRRVEKMEYDGNTLTRHTRFAYMGYLMIASMDCTQNITPPALLGTWFWDPSEPVATRALAMCTHNADKSVSSTRYVAHDLLKSVSALFDSSGTRQAKFEYTPYGETLTEEGNWASMMPFRYSSEYRDEDLGLIYYNYRHYNPRNGRWISRDIIGEEGGENLYNFVNNSINLFDKNGLKWNVICTEKLDCPKPVPGLGSGRGRVIYGEKESLTYAVKELNRDGKICYKLELNGTLTLKLEMLDRKHEFFARGRFPRFDKKWGVPRSNNLEWQAVRAHERDHRNTFTIGAREEFNKLNEQYDGKVYSTKEEAEKAGQEAEKKKNSIYDQALKHSEMFDKPKYDQGDMYKEYPFKYKPEK